MYVFTYMYLIN